MIWIWDPVLQIIQIFSKKTLTLTSFMTWLSIIAKCFIIQMYSNVCANTHNSIAVLKVDGMVRNTVEKKNSLKNET